MVRPPRPTTRLGQPSRLRLTMRFRPHGGLCDAPPRHNNSNKRASPTSNSTTQVIRFGVFPRIARNAAALQQQQRATEGQRAALVLLAVRPLSTANSRVCTERKQARPPVFPCPPRERFSVAPPCAAFCENGPVRGRRRRRARVSTGLCRRLCNAHGAERVQAAAQRLGQQHDTHTELIQHRTEILLASCRRQPVAAAEPCGGAWC